MSRASGSSPSGRSELGAGTSGIPSAVRRRVMRRSTTLGVLRRALKCILRVMPQGFSAPVRPESRPGLPTLLEHLERVRGYLRGLGLLAFPITETPLRRKLADFMETHHDEVVNIWVE